MQRTELTAEDLGAFISIWARESGEMLTEDQARIEATRVMKLYEALAQPLPGEPGYKAKEAGLDPEDSAPSMLQ